MFSPKTLRFSLRLIATVVLIVTLSACIGGGEEKLIGTDLEKVPAPDFTLTDYRGGEIRLSDLRGKAVVVTFIYTTCPDICPLLAENLRLTYEQLSAADREKVAMVAITVDPERDSAEALRGFSEAHGLDDYPGWHAVYGERTDLQPIWATYAIDPGQIVPHRDQSTSDESSPAVLLSHTDAVYLIDPEGRERVFMRSGFDPKDLAKNLSILTD